MSEKCWCDDRREAICNPECRVIEERDRYRQALLNVTKRVMTFGGFQRTSRGEFWVSRDDVVRCIDEELAHAGRVGDG